MPGRLQSSCQNQDFQDSRIRRIIDPYPENHLILIILILTITPGMNFAIVLYAMPVIDAAGDDFRGKRRPAPGRARPVYNVEKPFLQVQPRQSMLFNPPLSPGRLRTVGRVLLPVLFAMALAGPMAACSGEPTAAPASATPTVAPVTTPVAPTRVPTPTPTATAVPPASTLSQRQRRSRPQQPCPCRRSRWCRCRRTRRRTRRP